MFALSNSTEQIIENVMGPVGCVLANIMFLSAVPVLRFITRTKSVGEYSVFPYLVQTCNCALWVTYSITDWQYDNMLWPGVTNGLGFLVASTSLSVFCFYCDRAQLKSLLPYLLPPLLLTSIFCIVALSLMTKSISEVAGTVCLVINMIMYMGPCAGVKAAISARTTEFMPLSLGVSTITCSVPWLLYGIVLDNLNIYMPNACGVVFGSIQVIVYIWLSRREASKCPSASTIVVSVATVNPMVQAYATAGDLSFVFAGAFEARSLRQVQTWNGSSPLCALDGAVEEGDTGAPLPRARSPTL